MKPALIYFIIHSIFATAYCVYLEREVDLRKSITYKSDMRDSRNVYVHAREHFNSFGNFDGYTFNAWYTKDYTQKPDQLRDIDIYVNAHSFPNDKKEVVICSMHFNLLTLEVISNNGCKYSLRKTPQGNTVLYLQGVPKGALIAGYVPRSF